MSLNIIFHKAFYKIIMWNIIIILTLVYCNLYKILKEYSWNTFKKLEGFFLHYLIICLNNLNILKIKRLCNILNLINKYIKVIIILLLLLLLLCNQITVLRLFYFILIIIMIMLYKYLYNCLKYIKCIKFKEYEKDLLKLSKSLKHNLIVFKNETNPNIYFFITKTSDFNAFKCTLNSFESEFKSKLINIKQTDEAIGFSQCLFQLELQKSNDFDKFLAPLSEDAEKLYKAVYSLNKNNTGSWIDVTRYFFQYDEMIKQHSYINFNKDPYYPFKPYTFEYNDLNKVDLEAHNLLKILEKPENL